MRINQTKFNLITLAGNKTNSVPFKHCKFELNMPRNRSSNLMYARISVQDKQRLLDAHESGADFLPLASILGIKRATAYSIIRKGTAMNRPRGGNIHKKVDQECIDKSIQLLEDNPLLTIKELNVKLHQILNHKPQFSDQALSAHLDGSLITLKLARDEPAERNTPSTIEERYHYAIWLMGPNVVNEKKYFIDEFGINIHTRRSQGRSLKGERVFRKVNGQRGPNITICIAVSSEKGLVHYQIFMGGMTTERFSRFLEVLCGNEIMADNEASGICIYDNARPHVSITDADLPGNFTIHKLPR